LNLPGEGKSGVDGKREGQRFNHLNEPKTKRYAREFREGLMLVSNGVRGNKAQTGCDEKKKASQ